MIAGLMFSQDAPATSPAAPDLLVNDLVFVVDPDFGMEGGVRSTRSLGRILFLYDETLRGMVDFDESDLSRKVLGMLGRLLKVTFVDLPLASLEVTVVHEVFGHVARARENGLSPSFQFSLPYPYRLILDREIDRGGSAANGRADNLERDLFFIAGGIESNHFAAWHLMSRFIMPSGRAHYSEALVYARSKLTYATALFGLSSADANPFSDPHSYMTALQQRFNRWRSRDRAQIADRLQIAWFWIFSDPMFWVSAYEIVVEHIYAGARWMDIPTLDVGRYQLFPGTRFNLSPFGAEHYVDFFLRERGGLLLDLYGRIGSSGLASYSGGGVHAFGYRPGLGFELGTEIDFWNQPQILFDHRNVFFRDNSWGGGVGLHVTWRITRPFAIVGKLAAKSHGYLMGQPIEAGLYGYVGLALSQANDTWLD